MARRKKSLPPIPEPLVPRIERPLDLPCTDRALGEVLESALFRKAVVWSAGRGQIAQSLAGRGEVILFAMDLWLAEQSRAWLDEQGAAEVEVRCGADWPETGLDLAVISLPAGGQEELALDLIQSAWLSLEPGGSLAVAVAAESREWLRKSLLVYSASLQIRDSSDATVITVIATGELKRKRDWQCELAFRDAGNLIRLLTRPGVFAHRQMDNGARQLLNSVQLESGARILDIGCGSGAVSLGLARRDPTVQVLAVDSHARAVDCTATSAELNGLTNLTTLLAHDGHYDCDGEMDVALGNPPYYSGFRIARLFCEAAARSLRPGGRGVFVTKNPEWFRQHLPEWFDEVADFPSGRYHIATGLKPESD